LIFDEIENFDDKLLHAAHNSPICWKKKTTCNHAIDDCREGIKTATQSSSCLLWIAFPHTTTSSKKKKDLAHVRSDANCGPYSFSKHRQQKKSARSKKENGQSALFLRYFLGVLLAGSKTS
jgi:hypothetical protein